MEIQPHGYLNGNTTMDIEMIIQTPRVYKWYSNLNGVLKFIPLMVFIR